MYSWK